MAGLRTSRALLGSLAALLDIELPETEADDEGDYGEVHGALSVGGGGGGGLLPGARAVAVVLWAQCEKCDKWRIVKQQPPDGAVSPSRWPHSSHSPRYSFSHQFATSLPALASPARAPPTLRLAVSAAGSSASRELLSHPPAAAAPQPHVRPAPQTFRCPSVSRRCSEPEDTEATVAVLQDRKRRAATTIRVTAAGVGNLPKRPSLKLVLKTKGGEVCVIS